MLSAGHWALALINSLERNGINVEEGIEFLKILAAWVKKLPGEVSGSSAAKKAELLIRKAYQFRGSPPETVIRFFALMIRKKNIRHLDSVIEKARELLDKKNGVIAVSLEYTQSTDKDLLYRIKEDIKAKSPTGRLDLTESVNNELIGGYRLRIGDKIIDACVRSQLKKLEASLAGSGGY